MPDDTRVLGFDLIEDIALGQVKRSFQERGAKFHGQPRVEANGTVGVFSDLHGNKWDLLQLNVR